MPVLPILAYTCTSSKPIGPDLDCPFLPMEGTDEKPITNEELELPPTCVEQKIAAELATEQPASLKNQLVSNKLQVLIVLPDGVVNAAMVIRYAKWCIPFAKYIPTRVPTKYQIARTLYLLDSICEHEVFRYAEDKLQTIIIEAGRLKEINSYARLLMRRSPYSRNKDLQLLKSLYTTRRGGSGVFDNLPIEGVEQLPVVPVVDAQPSVEYQGSGIVKCCSEIYSRLYFYRDLLLMRDSSACG